MTLTEILPGGCEGEMKLVIAVKFISGSYTYSHECAGHQSHSQALTEQVSGNEG